MVAPMNLGDFNMLVKQLHMLTDKQRQSLKRLLYQSSNIIEDMEQRIIEKPECPHCHSSIVNRHGKAHGMQRYRCKNCLTTFNAATGTPMARLRYKERWQDYLSEMLKGHTLKNAAEHCAISIKTAFRWRHRFLALPAQDKPALLAGIIETDETFFPNSNKGCRNLQRAPKKRGGSTKRGRSLDDKVAVLTVRDRGKHTYEAVLKHLKAEDINQELERKLQTDSVLCSDGFKPYIEVAKKNDLVHKQLNISQGIRIIDKIFHIQNVNAYHQRLKNWMRRFNGVSTQYLEHYLGWFRLMDGNENLNSDQWLRYQQHLTGK